jgi:hypothetical protein
MLKWYEPSKGEPPFAEAGNPFLNVKFTFGDLVEELAVVMIENAGYEVTDRQKRVETPDYELTSWKARGSMDGKIGNCVVDIKSCADVSFQKYKRLGNTLGDDPFGYAAQIDGYAYCEGTDERAIIFMNKHDGEIHIVDRTDESISAPYDRLIEIDTASSNMFQGKLPPMHPEAQTSNANGVKLGTVCSYCPFKYHCYQTAGMEITGHIKSGRPHYYVKESLTKEGHAERNSKASTIIHPPQAYQV